MNKTFIQTHTEFTSVLLKPTRNISDTFLPYYCPLCPSCVVEPLTIVHVFSCSSHPTPLIEMDLWERPRLASGFLSVFPFFCLPPLPPPPPDPLLMADKRGGGNHHPHHSRGFRLSTSWFHRALKLFIKRKKKKKIFFFFFF